MREVFRIPTPAVLYDAALAFCNERRAEAGLEPWLALPAGLGRSPGQCPCGQAVPGLAVYINTYYVGEYVEYGLRKTHGIRDFILHFDRHTSPIDLCLPVRTEP